MNWGYKIAIALALFMGFILYMVISAHQNTVDLVAEDYYQQEIEYQNRIDAKINGNKFTDEIAIENSSSTVSVILKENFPKDFMNGKVYFFKPDNSAYDKLFKLKPNENLVLDKEKLGWGNYIVKIEFERDNKLYHIEKRVYL